MPFQREVVWNLAAVACGCGATLPPAAELRAEECLLFFILLGIKIPEACALVFNFPSRQIEKDNLEFVIN